MFMMQVLAGCAIMVLTVIPLSQQDSYLVPRAMTEEELAVEDPLLNIACMVDPIVFSFGFFMTFSAMFLKSWRLIRIFNNSKLKNLFLRDRQLLMYQFLIVVLVCVLNGIWAGIDPMVWQRSSEFLNSDGLVIGSIGICVSRTGIAPALPLLIGIMGILLMGNYLSYLGRRIPTEFNESKWTAMTMVMIMEAFVIGIPVLVLANNDPIPGYIIKCMVVLMVSGATVGLIFGPKVAIAYGWGEEKDTSNPWRFVGASGSSGNKKSSGKDKLTAESKNTALMSTPQVVSKSKQVTGQEAAPQSGALFQELMIAKVSAVLDGFPGRICM
jgi:hypothetical protein